MSDWLSYWDQARRERHEFRTRDSDPRPPLSALEIPYGRDHVKAGDRVFAISAIGGRLMLIGRVIVDAVTEEDPLGEGTVGAVGREGTLAPPRFDRFAASDIVAALRCLNIHGYDCPLNPDFVFVDVFHGDQGLLELVAGGEALDELAEEPSP